jgi:hypothetical protein
MPPSPGRRDGAGAAKLEESTDFPVRVPLLRYLGGVNLRPYQQTLNAEFSPAGLTFGKPNPMRGAADKIGAVSHR